MYLSALIFFCSLHMTRKKLIDFPTTNIFLACCSFINVGICDDLKLYLSCHKRSFVTELSEATKN
jgi:hypothetical protein